MYWKRLQQRGNSEYSQEIENIASEDIPNSDIGMSAERRNY